MIVVISSIVLVLIFAILSSFHFYWLFGGSWGVEKVIPSKGNKVDSLSIPKFTTLIVALILAEFGIFYFVKSGLTTIQLLIWITNNAG